MLRLYAADGQRIHGVTPSRLSSVPFSADSPEPVLTPPTPPNFDDDETLQANLVKWLDGDEDQNADARQFFWSAFLHSPVIETIRETDNFGYGYRNYPHEYRRAHQMLEEFLCGCTDEDFFQNSRLARTLPVWSALCTRRDHAQIAGRPDHNSASRDLQCYWRDRQSTT